MQETILVVDDETAIRELVAFNLERAGYAVRTADNGLQVLAEAGGADLILLDLMLPGIDGMEVCRRLKSSRETEGIPLIMLTAKGEEIDKILGLEMGADDYMTKPFSPRELVARVKAVLRRGGREAQPQGELAVGALRMNFARYEAFLGAERLELTPKEYELLKLFSTNVGRTYSREQLLEKVWGYEYYGDTRTVDVHIRHLRAKLAPGGLDGAVETVRGIGYRFSGGSAQ